MVCAINSLVPLRHGPSVPGTVVLWLLDAERRGLQFQVEDDGSLFVSPRGRMTNDDDAFIRAHRETVLACVRYVGEVVV
jgi:hypothetical protein